MRRRRALPASIVAAVVVAVTVFACEAFVRHAEKAAAFAADAWYPDPQDVAATRRVVAEWRASR